MRLSTLPCRLFALCSPSSLRGGTAQCGVGGGSRQGLDWWIVEPRRFDLLTGRWGERTSHLLFVRPSFVFQSIWGGYASTTFARVLVLPACRPKQRDERFDSRCDIRQCCTGWVTLFFCEIPFRSMFPCILTFCLSLVSPRLPRHLILYATYVFHAWLLASYCFYSCTNEPPPPA